MEKLTFKNGIKIEWNHGDDGGGSEQYLDFLEVIPATKKYNKCLEWCAGLSAIAFSLVDSDIIEKCVLMDKYEPALKTAIKNAITNNINDRITYYVCDEISKLPESEKFDLVVGNPPHSFNDTWIGNDGMIREIEGIHRRLVVDLDGLIHKEFFNNITKYLNNGADIFLSETTPHNFLIDMAKDNGLTYVNSYYADQLAKKSNPLSVIMHFRYETEIH